MNTKIRNLERWYETVRHLRAVQIWGRIASKLPSGTPDARPPSGLRPAIGSWVKSPEKAPSMLKENTFCFLNQNATVEAASDWDRSDRDLLWSYNLHYFDDLNAQHARQRESWHKALIDRWLHENPPASGIGWAAYPISIRIANWIKWSLQCNHLSSEAIHSLAVQTRHLHRHLETQLQGNHLFANAKALFFSGCFFQGAEAEHWLSTGATLLEAQSSEQILADGGHFELSPMYHALILQDILDVLNVSRIYFGDQTNLLATLRRKVEPMFRWFAAMLHPDGEIGFFNDAVLDSAPTYIELHKYAARLGVVFPCDPATRLVDLADSGYARLQWEKAICLVDAAPVGPDHLPGHAHADSLSFELSVKGCRVLVNSGISQYGTGPRRQVERGTAAHNTVSIDGENSSDVWAGFRVGKRARIIERHVEENGSALRVIAAHDGFRRIVGDDIIHRRAFNAAEGLHVADEIEGKGRHRVECYFHVHPALRVVASDKNMFRLSGADGLEVTLKCDPSLEWRMEPSTYHRSFGLIEANVRIAGSAEAQLPLSFTNSVQWSIS
jgi:uncharacterized heparinase superfamily protein